MCQPKKLSYILQNIVNSTNMIKHYPVGTIHHLPVAGMAAERVEHSNFHYSFHKYQRRVVTYFMSYCDARGRACMSRVNTHWKMLFSRLVTCINNHHFHNWGRVVLITEHYRVSGNPLMTPLEIYTTVLQKSGKRQVCK